MRALTDGFDVDVGLRPPGERPVGAGGVARRDLRLGPERRRRRPPVDVAAPCRPPRPRRARAIGMGIVVSGSTGDLRAHAGGHVRVRRRRPAHRRTRRPGGRGRRADVSHGVRVLEIARLDQLPRLAAGRRREPGRPAAPAEWTDREPRPAGVVTPPPDRRLGRAALSGLVLLGLDDSYATRAYLVTGMVGVGRRWRLGAALHRAALPRRGVPARLLDRASRCSARRWRCTTIDLAGLPRPSPDRRPAHGDAHRAGGVPDHDPAGGCGGDRARDPLRGGVRARRSSVVVALRTRRPAAPRRTPRAGPGAGASSSAPRTRPRLVVRSAVFAVVAAAVGVRCGPPGDRGARSHRSWPGRRAAAVGVGAVAAGRGRWPPWCSRRRQDRAVLRGRVGSGQDVSQLDNPLARFRKFTSQPRGAADNVNDKRLLRVTGLPRSDLLRFVALDVVRRHAPGPPATARSSTTTPRSSSGSGRASGAPSSRSPGRGWRSR